MRYTIFFLAALFLNACSSLPEAVRGDFGTAPLPAVQASGADWAGKDIVGADIVKSAGGRVARITLVKGKSTTNIIRKILSIHKAGH